MAKQFFLLLIVGALLAQFSCAQKEIKSDFESEYVIIQNVPFIKQRDKYCGPASLASVLQFYGDDINQDEIADEIYIPELNGALISDLENYASSRGYKVESSNGNIDILESNIDNGTPVIILVDKGKWKVSVPHYYVAFGYNNEKEVIVLNTGYKKSQEISFGDLHSEWDKMNNLMLVITQ